MEDKRKSRKPKQASVALREFKAALKQAEHKGEGQKFFELMKEEWSHVKYDENKKRGEVSTGLLGNVEFQESGNDPAVVATVKGPIRIKASAEDVAKALAEIADILKKTGV